MTKTRKQQHPRNTRPQGRLTRMWHIVVNAMRCSSNNEGSNEGDLHIQRQDDMSKKPEACSFIRQLPYSPGGARRKIGK